MIPKMLMIEPSYQQGLATMLQNLDKSEAVTDITKPKSIMGVSILVIPVHGYLEHRCKLHYQDCFTGYGFIDAMVRKAMLDDSIDGVIFDINSGGGMVNGVFELSDNITRLSNIKPTATIIDAHCYSAAYAIASNTGTIYMPVVGGVGSIGVISSHTSLKKMYDDMGIDTTLVFSGDHKADGNMFDKLPERVRNSMQESNDRVRTIFAETVSKGRGISVSDVLATEAAIYSGDEAVKIGLVDVITSPADAYQMFIEKVKLFKNTNGGVMMSKPAEVVPVAAEVGNEKAAVIEPVSTVTEPVTVTAESERNRIKGITMSDEASGRERLASYLAYDTDMSVDDAKSILLASEKITSSESVFINAMESSGQPNINADDGDSITVSASDKIIADFQSVTGIKGN